VSVQTILEADWAKIGWWGFEALWLITRSRSDEMEVPARCRREGGGAADHMELICELWLLPTKLANVR
jgi:hypothetical protein